MNPQLSQVFSELGHTEQMVVTDAGLPVPQPVERADLALAEGVPGFLQVLDQTLAEIVIEGAPAPAEIEPHSPEMLAALCERLDRLGADQTLVPHAEFRKRSGAAIPSGEFTPYAQRHSDVLCRVVAAGPRTARAGIAAPGGRSRAALPRSPLRLSPHHSAASPTGVRRDRSGSQG